MKPDIGVIPALLSPLNEDETIDVQKLAGGASGSAAIYTDSMQPTHVIRQVMIRMDAWMNYIIP